VLDRGDDLDDRVEATTLALRAAAVEAQMSVSGDGRISESCAAELMQIVDPWGIWPLTSFE
jgi:hypothetical protein